MCWRMLLSSKLPTYGQADGKAQPARLRQEFKFRSALRSINLQPESPKRFMAVPARGTVFYTVQEKLPSNPVLCPGRHCSTSGAREFHVEGRAHSF